MPFDQTIRLIITVKNPYFNIYLFYHDARWSPTVTSAADATFDDERLKYSAQYRALCSWRLLRRTAETEELLRDEKRVSDPRHKLWKRTMVLYSYLRVDFVLVSRPPLSFRESVFLYSYLLRLSYYCGCTSLHRRRNESPSPRDRYRRNRCRHR